MSENQKHIIVLGAAESGVGAAILAQKKGCDVFVSDNGIIKDIYKNELKKYAISFEEKQHSVDRILAADEIIISPGIPLTIPLVVKAKELGISVISEIEFAYRYTDAHITAITGSNGKTTTATMTYELMKSGGLDVALAGNIGDSFARKVALENHDYYVLEISSFQLDSMYQFKANTAILLNITPDHLDRYNYDFNLYALSKFRIIQNMTSVDSFIYNADDKVITELLEKQKTEAKLFPFSHKQELDTDGAFIKDNKIHFQINTDRFTMDIEKLALQGRHNAYNTMAGGIAAKLQGIRKESLKNCLSDFQGMGHRLEKVNTVRGVSFINDSKATNVNSAWYALESMTKPVIWIVGGQDKGNDYTDLIPLAAEKVKAIVCLGIDNTKIIEAFSPVVSNIVETDTAHDAVLSSFYLAEPGDVVLLSPACASFDLFESYEDRGNRFIRAVQDL
jgi:UDP-N-acetylmuramoylalanine--D-glutamate ligase